jgi:hypothetical protein
MKKTDIFPFSPKYIVALAMADIDIFLLTEKGNQGKDKKKKHSASEVRKQLEHTMIKIMTLLTEDGVDIDKAIPRSTIPHLKKTMWDKNNEIIQHGL